MRRWMALFLAVAMAASIFCVTPAAAAEADADGFTLAYEVDFRGTKDIFEPGPISGNYSGFSYTPSADGTEITVKGNDYESSGEGKTGATYWGAQIKGLTADDTVRYNMYFKVRNNSTKSNSQVGFGGWVTEFGTKFWNLSSSFLSTSANVLGMLNGNSDSTPGTDSQKALMKSGDVDSEGFADFKIEFDGVKSIMRTYVKKDGEWALVFKRDISVGGGNHMGIIFYTYRTGSINMTFKDVKFYSDGDRVASTVETATARTKNYTVTSYETVPNAITLAEAKHRYGIADILSADGIASRPMFRNKYSVYTADTIHADAYLADIPYASDMGVTFTKPIEKSVKNNARTYVTFTAAIAAGDTALQAAPEKIKLLVTTDGVNYTDSGAVFTAKKLDETVTYASDVMVNTSGDYGFPEDKALPVYEFTSSTFAAPGLKNVKLVPAEDGKGVFRVTSFFVWAYGDDIAVPVLDGGNKNPEVKKLTKSSGLTDYTIYATDFADVYGWMSNVRTFRVGEDVTYQGAPHTNAAFKFSGTLPTYDGREARIYSPDMELDASLFTKLTVSFTCFRIDEESDPALDKIRLGYSTDGALTWQEITTKPETERISNGVEGEDTVRVSMNLKKYLPDDQIITNLIIFPYGTGEEASWYKVIGLNDNENSPSRIALDMQGTRGAFRMLDFSIIGRDTDDTIEAKPAKVYRRDYDALVIQELIDSAKEAGKTEATIPATNPRTGDNNWEICRTIKVPSDMTVYINNCNLIAGRQSLNRIMENEHCGSSTLAMEDHDIHIIGIGDAQLMGTKIGITTTLSNGTGVSTMDMILMPLHNLRNYSVENLRFEEARFWSLAQMYCRNGRVEHLDFFNNRPMTDLLPLREQDGIDVRNGCENIVVNDITGRTGDDMVALNAIRPNISEVTGKHNHIYNIEIRNVHGKLENLRMNLRLTANNGYQIKHILADGIYDTMLDFGGKRNSSVVRIGDGTASYVFTATQAVGEVEDLFFRNINGETQYILDVRHENIHLDHWAYEYDNVTNTFYGGNPLERVVGYGHAGRVYTESTCKHTFTRELTGTAHLRGLPVAAAGLHWLGCADCNAIKRPDGLEEILAKAAENTADASVFRDVAATSPFRDAIGWAVAEGVTVGKTATTFEPSTVCTVGNIITFIWRSLACPEPSVGNPFTDVSSDAYYYKAALWAYEKGLVSGTRFGANDPCTRAMTVTYIWKLENSPERKGASVFTDVAADADYSQAVAWAVERGITQGVTDTTFLPNSTCTRGQIVTFINRWRT
ncbi:MAG: S-layer homology domain-containing protein [Oscillibacter sp.]|nr:S-layer homology domain-containing protein [Oscillibacter sp.]